MFSNYHYPLETHDGFGTRENVITIHLHETWEPLFFFLIIKADSYNPPFSRTSTLMLVDFQLFINQPYFMSESSISNPLFLSLVLPFTFKKSRILL